MAFINAFTKEAAKKKKSNTPPAGKTLGQQLAERKAQKAANPVTKLDKIMKHAPKNLQKIHAEGKAQMKAQEAQEAVSKAKAARQAAIKQEAKKAAPAAKSGFLKHWPKAAGGAAAIGAAAYGYHKYKQKKDKK